MIENHNCNSEPFSEEFFSLTNGFPNPKVKILNFVKYQSMLQSVFLLKNILAETQDSVEITVDVMSYLISAFKTKNHQNSR